MDCLIISGMSGAGKSLAVDVLEDIGYYCVDNMPVRLMPRFIELFADSSARYKQVAFVVDVRGNSDFQALFSTLDDMRRDGISCRVLFLECSDRELINRHKATRRRHPLDVEGRGIAAAVADERALLEPVKNRADYLIDTTVLSNAQFKQHLINLFGEEGGQGLMVITVNSFGFKYGIPHESDMVFDVRFMRNPYYVTEFRDKNGMDKPVYDYIFESGEAEEFSRRLADMLSFLIPQYIKEGKTSLVVSVGCTGGRHRSVAVAERLHADLKELGHQVAIKHRDVARALT